MDIGTISGSTFDIDSVAETESVLVQSDTNGIVKNRWLYKDEQSRLVIHERCINKGNVVEKGSYVTISEVPGYGQESLMPYSTHTVGKLATTVDFQNLSGFKTKQITHNNQTFTAVLVPVIL